MKRRSLLLGTGALALTQLLAGCNTSTEGLRVLFLKDSIPPQLLKDFRQHLAKKTTLSFAPREQLAELFALLERWHHESTALPSDTPSGGSLPRPSRSPAADQADLVTLGDSWLTAAIQQGLVQPLDLEQLSGWAQLPPEWQALVRRDQAGNLDPQGQVWAAPYRWGTLTIAYHKEKFDSLGWTPQDWADLWRPELKQHISLPDNARAVIGLTLKKLGRSVNSENLQAIATLQSELTALQQQVKFYSSEAYLQPLILEDTWLAVGWSTDLLPIVERNPAIAAVTPASGTILWSDLWVRPANVAQGAARSSNAASLSAANSPAASSSATSSPAVSSSSQAIALAEEWIDFCWNPEIATKISLLTAAASPIVALNRADLPDSLKNNALLLPDPKILRQSEFLLPLPAATVAQYRQMWETVRQSGVAPSN